MIGNLISVQTAHITMAETGESSAKRGVAGVPACHPLPLCMRPMEIFASNSLGVVATMRTHCLRARVRRRSSKRGHEGVDVHAGQFLGLPGSLVRAVERPSRGAVPAARTSTTQAAVPQDLLDHVALRRFDEGYHLHLAATRRTNQGVPRRQSRPESRVGHPLLRSKAAWPASRSQEPGGFSWLAGDLTLPTGFRNKPLRDCPPTRHLLARHPGTVALGTPQLCWLFSRQTSEQSSTSTRPTSAAPRPAWRVDDTALHRGGVAIDGSPHR